MLVSLEGSDELPLTINEEPNIATIMVNFLIMNTPLTYNAILERLTLNALKVATSTYRMVKFSIRGRGTCYIRRYQYNSRKCYATYLKDKSIPLESFTNSLPRPKKERLNHLFSHLRTTELRVSYEQ